MLVVCLCYVFLSSLRARIGLVRYEESRLAIVVANVLHVFEMTKYFHRIFLNKMDKGLHNAMQRAGEHGLG